MVYTLLLILGVVCLAAWVIMLFLKPKSGPRGDLVGVVRAMNISSDLNPKEIQRNLTFYAGDRSALQIYVSGLRERFEMHVGIKVIAQKIREANVRKELLDAACEMLQAERGLQRLPQVEDLKDAQVKTQLLEEQQKQEKIQRDMRGAQEIADLDLEYNKKKRRKDIADLDKEPPESKPRPRPSPEEVVTSKMAGRRKIREQVQAEEREELLKFRLEMRPNPSKDKQVYEDEAVWLADWREVGGDHELFVLGQYENIKKRYSKMLDDALAELG